MANPVKQPDSVYSITMPHEAVSMDPPAFDAFVNNNGIKLIHFRALPCPVGLEDPDDIRRPHEDHAGCSNGFIYLPLGRVTCFFLTNQTQIRKLDAGFVDGSSVAVTFPRFYDSDSRRVMVRPFDRFYLEEEGITSAATSLMKRRHDGKADRTAYPARAVQHLMDSAGQRFFQGTDFDLVTGDVAWRPGHGPKPGTVYTIWYEYQPFYYCDHLIHEIRVVPTRDFIDTSLIRTERLSFAAILNREYVHRDQKHDPKARNHENRQGQGPDRLEPDEPGVTPNFKGTDTAE